MTGRIALAISVLLLALATAAAAQWEKKNYTEWSNKEADKMLNDSPWGQTQTLVDTSRMFDRDRRLDSAQSRVADVAQVNFRIRFMSAKPIRQAVTRSIEIQNRGELPEAFAKQLKAFIDMDFSDHVFVVVQVDAPSPSVDLNSAVATLNKLTTTDLKNNTYLLTSSGQRIFIKEYQTPRNDGLGARFIFPRLVDGKPILTPDSGDVLFYSDMGGLFIPQTIGERKPFALSMRYKVKAMMFNGKLEY